MSETPEDVLKTLNRMARDLDLGTTEATPLLRTLLVLQSKPGVYFDVISKRVFDETPRDLEKLVSHPKFQQYYRGGATAAAAAADVASTSSGICVSNGHGGRLRKSNRSLYSNDREYGSPVWHSLFHFAQLPSEMDPVKSGAVVHKTLKTLACFDRDLTHAFPKAVSRKAVLPLYCMAHLEARNLANILSGWSPANVSRSKAAEIAAWISAWQPLGGERAHATDLGELVANLDFPAEVARLADLREQARLNQRNAPPPLRNGHTTYEASDSHAVITSDFVRQPHDIDALNTMSGKLHLRESLPQNRVNLLFLITQLPNPVQNYDDYFDVDDDATRQRLRDFVGEGAHYTTADEWRRFIASTLMHDSEVKHTRIDTGSKRTNKLLDDAKDVRQHEALATALQNASADVARMNSVDKMARLVTAYAHEWQEKWDGLFGSLTEEMERDVEQFKEHHPTVDSDVMEALVSAVFSA